MPISSRTLTIDDNRGARCDIKIHFNSDGNNLDQGCWRICKEFGDEFDDRNRILKFIPHRCNNHCMVMNDGLMAMPEDVVDFWGKHGYEIDVDKGDYKGKHRRGQKNTRRKKRIVFWDKRFGWSEATRTTPSGPRHVRTIDLEIRGTPAPLS